MNRAHGNFTCADSRTSEVAAVRGGRHCRGDRLAQLPSASAEPCVVTVTLLGGVRIPFTIDVPPGTPLSNLSLPVKLPILSESES